MKKTLLYLVTQIVDHPDDVTIDEETGDGKTLFIIHTNKEDMGKIIGKGGRIIKAIRDLVKLMATRENAYVDVMLAEDNAQ